MPNYPWPRVNRIPYAGILAALLVAAVSLPAARATQADDGDIAVDVEIVGRLVRITSSLYVAASPGETWAVLTDYDHATAFISGLEISRVEAREGDVLYVHQKGEVKHGPLSFSFDSTRRVRLTPFEKMESHLVTGTMKKLDATTLLKSEGTGTRISDYRETIPNFWIPPVVGRLFIEHDTRQNFAELRGEILRRKKATRKE